MKLKLGVICGILIWIFTCLITHTIHMLPPDNNMLYNNLIQPLSIIIVTGFFTIIYIRDINEDELIEGIIAGIIFIAVDIVLDVIFFILPHNPNPIFSNFLNHIILMSITNLIITSFIGYLAQMTIELK